MSSGHALRVKHHAHQGDKSTHTVIKRLNAKVEVKMGRITRDARKLLIGRLGGKNENTLCTTKC